MKAMELFIIILLGYCIYLHTKISKLEELLKKTLSFFQQQKSLPLNQVPVPEKASASSVAESQEPDSSRSISSATQNQPAFSAQSAMPSASPDAASRFFAWLSTDWLLKIGAFLVLLGIGWFVRYAFAQNWIGPIGRISLGLVTGLGILCFGEMWGKKRQEQGTVFLVLGATTILLTIYAARTVYEFFTPVSATMVMFSAVVCIALSSVLHKVQSRAALGLLLAAIVPFLTHSSSSSAIGLLGYLFLVVAGTIWIVSLTGWSKLTFLGMGMYAIYSLLVLLQISHAEFPVVKILITGFTVMFYSVNLIAHLRTQRLSKTEYFTAVLNAIFAAIWIYTLAPEYLRGLITCATALFFFIGAYLLYRKSQQKVIVLEYTGIALMLLAAAASFQFSGPTLTIAYSALVGTAVVTVWLISGAIRPAQLTGLLFIPVFARILDMISQREYSYYISTAEQTARIFQQTRDILLVLGFVWLEVAVLGYWFYKKGKKIGQISRGWTATYLITALYLALYWIWKALEFSITKADTAHIISLLIITVIGLACYVQGRLLAHKIIMYTGASVLAVVVIRLFLVEVWSMALIGRVIVFLLVGALLMSTAFLKPVAKKEPSEA